MPGANRSQQQRRPPAWTVPLDADSIARLAEDVRVAATPTRMTLIARLLAGSAELSELVTLPHVSSVTRQSVHEGLQTLIGHGWLKRERLADSHPWVYSLASADTGRSFRRLAIALIDTDVQLRYGVGFLRDLAPESITETRRNPRYCARCERLTGWFHEHRTASGGSARQVDA